MKNILIIIISVLLLAVGGFFAYNYFFKSAKASTSIEQQAPKVIEEQKPQSTLELKRMPKPSVSITDTSKEIAQSATDIITPFLSLFSMIGGAFLIVLQIIKTLKEINVKKKAPVKK
jgi:uncharacterized protein YneF (UPF0154 family)